MSPLNKYLIATQLRCYGRFLLCDLPMFTIASTRDEPVRGDLRIKTTTVSITCKKKPPFSATWNYPVGCPFWYDRGASCARG